MALSETHSLVDACSENEILKIVSNLPSGWKVVGLTELNQGKEPPCMARIFPQVGETKLNEHPNDNNQVIDNEVNVTDQSKINSLPGSLVSCGKEGSGFVSDGFANFSASDNIKASALPIVKTEIQDEGNYRSYVNTNINHCDKTNNFNISIGMDHPKSVNEKNTYDPQFPASTASKTWERAFRSSKHAVHHKQDILSPFRNDSKWTVVGITPLQHPQSTEAKFGAPYLSAATCMLQSEKKANSGHQSQTILNIPQCGSQNSDQTAPFNPNVSASLPGMNVFASDPEVMRWTVVGITTALSSSTNPFLMAPQSSSVTTTVSSGKISSLNTGETLPVTSSLVLPSGQSTKPSLLSKTTENITQSNGLLCAFPDLSSLVNSDIQSQVPNEWRVVGISPIVNAPNALSNLSHLEPDQLLPLPICSIASESGLITSSITSSTTTLSTSTTISQITTSCKPSSPEVTSTVEPLRSTIGHGPENNLKNNCNILTVPITAPGSEITSHMKDSLYVVNSDCHVLGSATSSRLQDGPKDFEVFREAKNSKWKVVGVVANNQVSMLPPDQRCEDNVADKDSRYLDPLAVAGLGNRSIPLPMMPSESKDTIKEQKVQSCNNRGCQYVENRKEDHENFETFQIMTQKNHEVCLDRKRQFDWNRRAKDMLKKTSTSKLKKNTVSNLLKIKRCQGSGPDHQEIHSGQEFYEDDHLRFPDDCPRKRCRSRSLRSYSGNRQQFQCSSDSHDSIFPLRSSSDTTASDHNSEEEIERNQLIKMEKLSPPTSPADGPEMHNKEISSHSFAKSPARRRKLKVPRKMVADLDYHPFDSSSDSN